MTSIRKYVGRVVFFALFVWGTILVLAFVSVLLIADSSRDDQTFVA